MEFIFVSHSLWLGMTHLMVKLLVLGYSKITIGKECVSRYLLYKSRI